MPTPDYMHAMEEGVSSQKHTSGNFIRWISVIVLLGFLVSALSLYLLSTSAVSVPQYSMDCLSKFNSTTVQPDQLKSCLVK